MISGRNGIYICPLLNMPRELLHQVILGFNLVTGVCSTAILSFTCALTKAPNSITIIFFESSFLSLKGESCPPHQFFKAHIKAIEICCLKKDGGLAAHQHASHTCTVSTAERHHLHCISRLQRVTAGSQTWKLNTTYMCLHRAMCPQGCQYSKEVEIFKCDEAKSFLCFDDGCSIIFNVFFLLMQLTTW